MLPIQSYNGYDKPWAGGTGNNLADVSLFSDTLASVETVVTGNEVHVTCDGTIVNQLTRIPPNEKTYSPGTYYIKFKVKNVVALSSTSCVSLRRPTTPYTLFSPINIVSGTTEYSATVTTTENSYLTIFGCTNPAAPAEFTVYDIMVSEVDVPYEPYENICPIYGHTSATLRRTGKNIANISACYSTGGATINYDSETDVLSISGSGTYSGAGISIAAKAGVRYDFSAHAKIINGGECRIGVRLNDIPNLVKYTSPITAGEGDLSCFYTPAEDCILKFLMFGSWSTAIPNEVEYTKFQCEVSGSQTPYERYVGDSYTDTFGEVVYGGSIDFATGILTKTWGHIASYAGETLPGEWLSDRDVYAEGATPTTGAEVAYELGAPVESQLAPQSITTLKGTNTIWVTTATNQP